MISHQNYSDRQQANYYYDKAVAEKSNQAAIRIYKQVLAVLDLFMCKQDEDIHLLIKAYSSLGACHFNLNLFEDADRYYKLCLLNHHHLSIITDDNYRDYIKYSIAHCYVQLELKNIPSAATIIQKCIPMLEKINNKIEAEVNLGNTITILQNPRSFYNYWSKEIALPSYLESNHYQALNHDAVLSSSESATRDETAEVTAMFNFLQMQNVNPQVLQQPQPAIPRPPINHVNNPWVLYPADAPIVTPTHSDDMEIDDFNPKPS